MYFCTILPKWLDDYCLDLAICRIVPFVFFFIHYPWLLHFIRSSKIGKCFFLRRGGSIVSIRCNRAITGLRKIFENLRKFRTNEKLAQMLYIYHNYTLFSCFIFLMSFFTHVFAQTFQSEHLIAPNKFAFRKSGKKGMFNCFCSQVLSNYCYTPSPCVLIRPPDASMKIA